MILTSGGSYLLSFALDLRHGAATPPEVFSLRKALTVATYLHALLDKLRIHYDDLPLVTRKNEESATIFMIGGLALGGYANGDGTFTFGPVTVVREVGAIPPPAHILLRRPQILSPDEMENYILRIAAQPNP